MKEDTEKDTKFRLKMVELDSFLEEKSKELQLDHNALLIGALNGILAYHSLLSDGKANFNTDITKFMDMLKHGK